MDDTVSDKSELQSIFDRVARHLLAQNQQSLDDNGECVYRSPEGLKCAVGTLIPDSLYEERFEGSCVTDLPKRVLEACGIVSQEARNLASTLQHLHDHYTQHTWVERLYGVAETHGLSAKVVDEFASESED